MTNTLLLAAPGSWLLIDQPMIRNIVDFSQSDYHSHTLTYGDTSLPTSTPWLWYGVMWCDVVWCHNVKGVSRLRFYSFLWKLEILLLLINQFDILSRTIFLAIEVSPQPEYFSLTVSLLFILIFCLTYCIWIRLSQTQLLSLSSVQHCELNNQ